MPKLPDRTEKADGGDQLPSGRRATTRPDPPAPARLWRYWISIVHDGKRLDSPDRFSDREVYARIKKEVGENLLHTSPKASEDRNTFRTSDRLLGDLSFI